LTDTDAQRHGLTVLDATGAGDSEDPTVDYKVQIQWFFCYSGGEVVRYYDVLHSILTSDGNAADIVSSVE
jgi:hypothetical protein